MPRDWYVKRPDGIDGPFTSSELRQRAGDNRLTPDSPVSCDRRQWVRASRLKGLEFGVGSSVPLCGDHATSGRGPSEPGPSSNDPPSRHGTGRSPTSGPVLPAAGRLWLMSGDLPAGPFGPAEVHEKLEAGEVTWRTVACPIGGGTWLPLAEFPGFGRPSSAPLRDGPSSFGLPSPAPSSVSSTREKPPDAQVATPGSVLTNPRLPDMANWICFYSILVSPILWFMGNATCLVTGPTFREDTPFFGIEVLKTLVACVSSLACTVVLFVGGLRLSSLKHSGVPLLRLGFGLSLALSAAEIVLSLLLGFIAAGAEVDPFAEASDVMKLVSFLFLGLTLAIMAFQIVALVWLARHSRSLPLG